MLMDQLIYVLCTDLKPLLMNRIHLILLLLLPLPLAAQYTMDRYHTKEGIAKNRIASYDILELKERSDGTADSVVRETLTFDEHGNLLSEYNHLYAFRHTYVYDSSGRLAAGVNDCPGIDRIERDTFIYVNDLLAKKISLVTDHGEESRDVVEYYYTNGLLTEEKVQWACCTTLYYRHKYDEKRRLISTDLNGRGQETFVYDEAGNLIEYAAKSPTSTVRDVFEYDGRLRVKQTISGAAGTTVFTMEYDENGLILRQDDWFYRYHYR